MPIFTTNCELIRSILPIVYLTSYPIREESKGCFTYNELHRTHNTLLDLQMCKKCLVGTFALQLKEQMDHINGGFCDVSCITHHPDLHGHRQAKACYVWDSCYISDLGDPLSGHQLATRSELALLVWTPRVESRRGGNGLLEDVKTWQHRNAAH